MALPIEYIRQPGQLTTAISEILQYPEIAVDTEANSRHVYPEQLCLIQIATPEKIYIIDPLTLDNIHLFEPVFSSDTIIKVFHTAEYDIRSLNKHLGFITNNAYDVAIAAKFLGMLKFGLANILSEFLEISITKNRKLQEGDWGIRPLSKEAIDYAADDVNYLLSLKKYCEQKLAVLGRTEWVKEECKLLSDLRYQPGDKETAYMKVKYSRSLDNQGRAILKSLHQYREKEALRYNTPPGYLLPDKILIHLAGCPEAELSDVPGLNESRIQRFGSGIEDALILGQNSPPIELVNTGRAHGPLDEEAELRFQHLREWRDATAESLALDPSLIWPRASLKRIAVDIGIFKDEIMSSKIRQWQRNQFSEALSALLTTFSTT